MWRPGGFGQQVLDFVAQKQLPVDICIAGPLPDRFVGHGDVEWQRKTGGAGCGICNCQDFETLCIWMDRKQNREMKDERTSGCHDGAPGSGAVPGKGPRQ